MRIAALYADIWNGWCTPDQLIAKSAVLDAHCDGVGRDPESIQRSTQAFIAISPAQDVAADTGRYSDRPWIRGTEAQRVDQLGRFAEAGADELIIADWNMDSVQEVVETLGALIELAA